jgi:Septum formation
VITSVFDIEVGDCFSADSDEVESVLVVDCEQAHSYEAFFVFDHDGGASEPYPGDDAIVDYAEGECRAPFEEFVGTDYDSSIWYITSVTPSAETWAEGDREIICTLDQQDQDGVAIEVTGSAEGSAE